MTEYLTADAVRERLREACAKAGDQAQWADLNGLSHSYVSDVLRARQAPGYAITYALGLERVVMWTIAEKRIDGCENVA